MKALVEKPDGKKLDSLGIKSWPQWTCGVSKFDWFYDEKETCYFYEGEVTVSSAEGKWKIGPGDLAVFPKGLKCVWEVFTPVRKAYRFGD